LGIGIALILLSASVAVYLFQPDSVLYFLMLQPGSVLAAIFRLGSAYESEFAGILKCGLLNVGIYGLLFGFACSGSRRRRIAGIVIGISVLAASMLISAFLYTISVNA